MITKCSGDLGDDFCEQLLKVSLKLNVSCLKHQQTPIYSSSSGTGRDKAVDLKPRYPEDQKRSLLLEATIAFVPEGRRQLFLYRMSYDNACNLDLPLLDMTPYWT